MTDNTHKPVGVYEIPEGSTDRLDLIFNIQSKLQERLGTWDKVNSSPSMRQQFFNQMFLAISEENVEIMRETAYKNPEFVPFGWKKTQVENVPNICGELIDMLHFWVNLCLMAHMTPEDVVQKYLEKNKLNHVRQDTGY